LIHEAANLPGFGVVAIHDCVMVPLPYVSKMKELYPRVLKKNLGRVTGEQFFYFWPNPSPDNSYLIDFTEHLEKTAATDVTEDEVLRDARHALTS
jgi:hypothetical protein